jgi:hypothetical protein
VFDQIDLIATTVKNGGPDYADEMKSAYRLLVECPTRICATVYPPRDSISSATLSDLRVQAAFSIICLRSLPPASSTPSSPNGWRCPALCGKWWAHLGRTDLDNRISFLTATYGFANMIEGFFGRNSEIMDN